MKKIALMIMILTVVSKVVGFLREIVLSYVYGASAITDAYLISQTIPIAIFRGIRFNSITEFGSTRSANMVQGDHPKRFIPITFGGGIL